MVQKAIAILLHSSFYNSRSDYSLQNLYLTIDACLIPIREANDLSCQLE